MYIIHEYVCFVLEGHMRHAPDMKPMGLAELLQKRYKWDRDKAEEFAQFLLPMLEYDPRRRATASQCLLHPWLTGCSTVSVVQKEAQKEDAEGMEKDTETETKTEVQLDEKKNLEGAERMDVADDRSEISVNPVRDGKDGETPGKDGDEHGKEEKRGKEEEKPGKEEEKRGKDEEKHGKEEERHGKEGVEQQNGDGKGREKTAEKEETEDWKQKMTEERLGNGTDVEMREKEGVR